VQDSLDLAQNAVVNFLTWGPRFVPENEAQFRALLKRIATNQLIDARRRQSLRDRGGHVESLRGSGNSFSGFGPAQHSSLGPSRAVERSEQDEWVRLALQFLEPDDRHLLIASEVEGQDWATIAQDLGLPSPDAARVRGTRLKSRVARLLMQLRRGRIPDEG
jgi:RNA polymerase sigma factor (sigma-70 family)